MSKRTIAAALILVLCLDDSEDSEEERELPVKRRLIDAFHPNETKSKQTDQKTPEMQLPEQPKSTYRMNENIVQVEVGLFARLNELRNDAKQFEQLMGLPPEHFDGLVDRIRPLLEQHDTRFCKAVPTAERLAFALRYLVTGASLSALSLEFRLSKSTMSISMPFVFDAIYQALKHDYIKFPRTEAEWRRIADGFEQSWNMPNCIGSLNGWHVQGTNSTVLLAMADADYKFVHIDVGAYGCDSDGRAFERCELSKALENNSLGIPPAQPLSQHSEPMPFVALANGALPLKAHLLTPFANDSPHDWQQNFNQLHGPVSRIVDGALGMCAERFGLLRQPIEGNTLNMQRLLLAICTLHNYLLTEIAPFDAAKVRSDDNRLEALLPLEQQRQTAQENECKANVVRNQFGRYFFDSGASYEHISWPNASDGIKVEDCSIKLEDFFEFSPRDNDIYS